MSVAMLHYFLMREFYQSQQLEKHMYFQHAQYLKNKWWHIFFKEQFFFSSLIEFAYWKLGHDAFSLTFSQKKSSHVITIFSV